MSTFFLCFSPRSQLIGSLSVPEDQSLSTPPPTWPRFHLFRVVFLDCWTLEDWVDTLLQNVGKQHMQCNNTAKGAWSLARVSYVNIGSLTIITYFNCVGQWISSPTCGTFWQISVKFWTRSQTNDVKHLWVSGKSVLYFNEGRKWNFGLYILKFSSYLFRVRWRICQKIERFWGL